MLHRKGALALAALASISNIQVHALSKQFPPAAPDETIPGSFDGQYVTKPAPAADNDAVEWWWFQALGKEVNGIIPSFEATYYNGFAFTRGPNDPVARFDVSGVFPNGSEFFISTPISVPPTITSQGKQAVVGDWDGLGSFQLTPERNSLVLTFNDSANGLVGTVDYTIGNTAAHGPCFDSTDVPPYFSPLAVGKNLTETEIMLYEQTGWAIAVPRAKVVIDVYIHGTHFKVEDALGYHDHNWAPHTLDKFAFTWLFGSGSCGPIDLTYLEVQAFGSTRDRDVVKGFLADNGKYLQNQCSLFGENRTKDSISIELTGQMTDPVTKQQVPTGIKLGYTLLDGTKYEFNLKNSVENPSLIPYHRWRLGGTGGKVGGPQYDCLMIGDWLNPGLANYTEGKSIFDLQS